MSSSRLVMLVVLLTICCCCFCRADADATQNQLEVPSRAQLSSTEAPEPESSPLTPVGARTVSEEDSTVSLPRVPGAACVTAAATPAAAVSDADERETVHLPQLSGQEGPIAAPRLVTNGINTATDASLARGDGRSYDLSPSVWMDAAPHGTETGAISEEGEAERMHGQKVRLQSTSRISDESGEPTEQQLNIQEVTPYDPEFDGSSQDISDSGKGEIFSNLVFIERSSLRNVAGDEGQNESGFDIEAGPSDPIMLSTEHSLLSDEHQDSEKLSEAIQLENVFPQAGKDLRHSSNPATRYNQNSATREAGTTTPHETTLFGSFHTELNSGKLSPKNSKHAMIDIQRPPDSSISGLKADNGISHISDRVASAKTETLASVDPFHKASGSIAGHVRSHAPWGRVRLPSRLIGREAVNDVKPDPSPEGSEPVLGGLVSADVTVPAGEQTRLTDGLTGSVTNQLPSRLPPERDTFSDSDLNVPQRNTGDTGTTSRPDTGTTPRPWDSVQNFAGTNVTNITLVSARTTEELSTADTATGPLAITVHSKSPGFNITEGRAADKSGAAKREEYYSIDSTTLPRSHLPGSPTADSPKHRENVTTVETTSQLREAITDHISNRAESGTAGSATYRRSAAVHPQTSFPTAAAAAPLSVSYTAAAQADDATAAAAAAADADGAANAAAAEHAVTAGHDTSQDSADSANWEHITPADSANWEHITPPAEGSTEHDNSVHAGGMIEEVATQVEITDGKSKGHSRKVHEIPEKGYGTALSWPQEGDTSSSLPPSLRDHQPTSGVHQFSDLAVTSLPHSTPQTPLYSETELFSTTNPETNSENPSPQMKHSKIYMPNELIDTKRTQLHPKDEIWQTIQHKIYTGDKVSSITRPKTHNENELPLTVQPSLTPSQSMNHDAHDNASEENEIHAEDKHLPANAELEIRPVDRYRYGPPRVAVSHTQLPARHPAPVTVLRSQVHGEPEDRYRPPLPAHRVGPQGGVHQSPSKVFRHSPHRSPHGNLHGGSHPSHPGAMLYPVIRPIPRPAISPYVPHSEEFNASIDQFKPLEESGRPLHLVIRSTPEPGSEGPSATTKVKQAVNDQPKRGTIAKHNKQKSNVRWQKLALYGDFKPVYVNVNHYIIPPAYSHHSTRSKPAQNLHAPNFINLSTLRKPYMASLEHEVPSKVTGHNQGDKQPFTINKHAPLRIISTNNSGNKASQLPHIRNYVAPPLTKLKRRSLHENQPLSLPSGRLQRYSTSEPSFPLNSPSNPPRLSQRSSSVLSGISPSPLPEISSAPFSQPSPLFSSLPSPPLLPPETSTSAPTPSVRPVADQTANNIMKLLLRANATTLVQLLKMAELDTLLAETGPYTLFAPTEEALNDLVERLGGTRAMLEKMGKANLVKLLLYHVMRGFALEEDLADNLLGRTLTGSRLRINQQRVTTRDGDTEARSGTGPSSNSSTDRGSTATASSTNTTSGPARPTITTVNGARLLSGPLLAENGVVYRVAAVLAPPQTDLLRALRADPRGRFTVLLQTLRLAGLYDKLRERQAAPLTILAPTNAAFASVPEPELRELLSDRRRLRKLLLSHVLSGLLYSTRLANLGQATTLSGAQVSVSNQQGNLTVDGITVLVPDISAENGVAHGIGTIIGLLLTSSEMSSAAPSEVSAGKAS